MFSPDALYVVGIMSCVLSMLVFGSLSRSGTPGLNCWLGANALIIAALATLMFNDMAPPPFTVFAASAFVGGSGVVVLRGCRQFFYLPPSRWYENTAYAIAVLGLAYWTLVSPSVNARIVLMSVFMGYVRVRVGWTAHMMRPPNRPGYSYRFVTFVAMLGAAFLFLRAVVTLLQWKVHAGFLEPSPWNVAYIGLSILSLPCLSIGAVMLAYDRMAERMERLASIDDLTGALVRREFLVRAGLQVAHANRTGSRFAVAIIDIDNFKSINDGHGHAAGDRALCHFASIVSKGIRRTDAFGRLGGEEFAVLLPSTSGPDAMVLLDRLRLQIANTRLIIPGAEVACTFSAGVDEYATGESLETLMARVDAVLYSAKAMGRNRVVAAALGKTTLTNAPNAF